MEALAPGRALRELPATKSARSQALEPWPVVPGPPASRYAPSSAPDGAPAPRRAASAALKPLRAPSQGPAPGRAPARHALAPGRVLSEAPNLAAGPAAGLGLEERLALIAMQPGVLPRGAAAQPPAALDYTLGAMALGEPAEIRNRQCLAVWSQTWDAAAWRSCLSPGLYKASLCSVTACEMHVTCQ